MKIFGLFGAVFLFGLVAAANGAWLLRYGRPNRWLQILAALLGIALFAGGAYVGSTIRKTATDFPPRAAGP